MCAQEGILVIFTAPGRCLVFTDPQIHKYLKCPLGNSTQLCFLSACILYEELVFGTGLAVTFIIINLYKIQINLFITPIICTQSDNQT